MSCACIRMMNLSFSSSLYSKNIITAKKAIEKKEIKKKFNGTFHSAIGEEFEL
jgi:hypothetical protein